MEEEIINRQIIFAEKKPPRTMDEKKRAAGNFLPLLKT